MRRERWRDGGLENGALLSGWIDRGGCPAAERTAELSGELLEQF